MPTNEERSAMSELLKRLGDKLYKVDDQVSIEYQTNSESLRHYKMTVKYRGVEILEVYNQLGTYLKFDNKKSKRWSSLDWKLTDVVESKKEFNHVLSTLKRNLKQSMVVVDQSVAKSEQRDKDNEALYSKLISLGFDPNELEKRWYGASIIVDDNEDHNIDLYGESPVELKIPVNKLKAVLDILAE